ncbi:Thioesterase/thiol ester dehydrase-isomerase [Tilletiaria anomala UBC 951]|uniref:Thioesterase/thiol ester dehydrase-isomerase n=1 Tax=Tilletiaria anomala (strain ATCC 24038 / CBS 436.72 / UBC 951) TaxID=1037660 RepID=A0A066WCF6_TILAU|nr:Thioesterase/thiol ester dehydrase-isomerase [Tilletiaria anomala UBC 951]KDN51416.1 Thioesterase/thiol ester dehydrase-isomerase [Tilletiaria anomala UBC 951]
MAASTKFVRRVTQAFMRNQGHDSVTMQNLVIKHATPGKVKASLKVEQHNVNRLGTVHGGLICTLTDTMGSLAIASHGFYSTGVSTDIHTTFVKPSGKVGDSFNVNAEVISLGKVMATTRMEIRHPVTDVLLAYGSHTKFVGKIHDHVENVVFDDSGDNVLKGKPMNEWPDA